MKIVHVKTRNTVRKRTLTASNRLEAQTAALYRRPLSEIEKLVGAVFLYRDQEVYSGAGGDPAAELRARFANIFFPALWDNHPEKFCELLKAITWANRNVQHPPPPKSASANLRWKLLLMPKALRKKTSDVKSWLAKQGIEIKDDASLCGVLRDLFPPQIKRKAGRPKTVR